MPLARTGVDREAKLEEILAAAERRLVAGGYAHMSVAAIARELGLVQNSIYWYFPSKDHLFVAVLRPGTSYQGYRPWAWVPGPPFSSIAMRPRGVQ